MAQNRLIGFMESDREHRLSEFLARFGSAVKDQRKNLGLSQEELAHRSGLHRTYVTDIERGTRNVSIDSVTKLAKALEVPLADLFEKIEKRPPVRSTTDHGIPIDATHAGRPVEILLVEDNPKHVELTLQALTKNRVTNNVTVVNSGEAALELLFSRPSLKQQPRLVLLDLSLQRISGLEVLRRIRSDQRTRSLPVVILTASRSDDDYAEIMELGVTAYISKPIDFVEFSVIIPKIGLSWQLVDQP